MQAIHKFCGVFIICIIIAVRGDEYPSVRVPEGPIQGYYKVANNGKIFSAFEGIPYAKPPVGKLRFEEPQPLTSWRGTWIANRTIRCLQYSHFGYEVIGQEDCLFLNIYTPKEVNLKKSFDVIVHIHGGAFMFGGAHLWGPEILMEHDVIYININYRLGPLGFLSTEDSVCPGNNGLKDQATALRWIKDNIEHFGGNPDSITITGLSAGGASVTYHYMSQWSQHLFNNGIALSGSALNPWAFSENNLEKARILGHSVGCDDNTTVHLIRCLKTRPAFHIVENVKYFLGYLYNPFSPFGPTIEKGGSRPFLDKSPYELMKNGKLQDLPIMFSVTQAEGVYPGGEFITDPKYLSEINDNWSEIAPHILDYNFTVPEFKRNLVAHKIKNYYLKGKSISSETFTKFIQMLSDRLFISTVEDTVRLFANNLNASVYFHYFNYRGVYSFSEKIAHTHDNLGVSHCDDSLYVLQFTKPPNITDDFRKMTEIYTTLWLTFAKTGVPKISGVDYKPVKINKGKFNYLDIEHPDNITMKITKSLSNNDFWSSLPLKENENI